MRLEKQPWKITRNQRIEAARGKIANPNWTAKQFRDYLEKLTAGGVNEWDQSKYDNPPVLTIARAKTEITKVATEMNLGKRNEKRFKTFAKEPTKKELEKARRQAEMKELKDSFLASLK